MQAVFFNRSLLVADDAKHFQRERRNCVVGRSNEGRLLSIIPRAPDLPFKAMCCLTHRFY